MPQITRLSEIVSELDKLIVSNYKGKSFWITAELSGVKKYPTKRWCFFDFIEHNENSETSIKAVCWAKSYQNIELFEATTLSEFKSGIEITCKVSVSFYKTRSYARLEIIEIDFAHAIGQLELEKQKTLKRLIAECKSIKFMPDGRCRTANNSLILPKVIQRIALITAANSDGQRDFKNVIQLNEYGYEFCINEFLTVIQGNNASSLILEKLKQIKNEDFDIVAIVRGGGSDIDFNAFNDFVLSKTIADFPIPILTGIGHDRNTSVVDLMARQFRTPTEIAKFVIDRNISFELEIQQLKERFFYRIDRIINDRKLGIDSMKKRVKNLNPITILNKGFAIIISDNQIVTDPENIKVNTEIKTLLKNKTIHSIVNKKT